MSVRIARVKIDRYGPLRDRDWDLEPGLTLFFGGNESGKTLVVESMVKLLLDGGGEFAAIDRVSGPPAGFLVVETDGRAVQVPDAGFGALFPAGTTDADLRNAFVIRDVDLRLPDRDRAFGHAEYLREVTDRVMGSQTRTIESVQARIAAIGNLANAESDRLMNRHPEKLKDRRDAAVDLADRLRGYREDAREAGILRAVRAKRDAEEELAAVTRELRALEKAERRDKLDRGRTLIRRLRRTEEALEAHEERRAEIEALREHRRAIDAYRESRSEAALGPAVYLAATAVAAGLVGLALLAAILSPVAGLGLVAGGLLLIAVYLGYRALEARRRLGERDRLIEAANYAGIDGGELPTVYAAIEEAIEDFEATERRLAARRSEVIGSLKGAFDGAHETLEEWAAAIDAFAETVEAVDRAYDEAEYDRLHERETTLRARIDGLRSDLDDHRDRLAAFDAELRDLEPEAYLDGVETVRVRSVEDLRPAIRVLETFVADLNDGREAARTAIELFEEIAADEEEQIDQLFAGDDFVVESFREVTGGRYTDVWFDQAETTIRVRRADDRTLTPYELSQGTYDLLYLIVRLKLAAALVGDETGFLVLDEAFGHSDAGRIADEIAMLGRLAEAGWQIVYFSFREAVREAVRDLEGGTVIELAPLAGSP